MIINMDCRAGMAMLPDQSVDAVVTDPPYGLSKQPNAREVLRHWLNGDEYSPTCGGFMGKAWDSFVPSPLVWEQALRVLKLGGYLVAFAGSRTQDLMTMSLRLAGFDVLDTLFWFYGSGMPKSLAIDRAIDKQRHERDQILEVTAWISAARDAAGVSNSDIDRAFGFNGMAGHWTSQASQPLVPTVDQIPALLEVLKRPDLPPRIAELLITLNAAKGTAGEERPVVSRATDRRGDGTTYGLGMSGVLRSDQPIRPEAADWKGFGTGLKPCYEPIILCRRPLDGTYANNVRAHGVGALNIDGCRVGDRWPTNVAHDGCLPPPMDRYFYSAKATREDRDAGLHDFAYHSAGEMTGGREEGSAGLSNGRAGAGRTSGGKNTHPTVKPTELMRWLCRLVTPPGGAILDPFAGSGSTGRGAVLEGFEFMGFELSAEYAAIATARIEEAKRGQ